MIFIPLSASAWALVRRKEPSANKDGTVDRCRGTKTGDIYCPGVPWSRDGNMGLIDELQQRSRGRLPDGQISHSRVQPHLQKYFLFSPDPNHFTYYRRLVPPEGGMFVFAFIRVDSYGVSKSLIFRCFSLQRCNR
jgi:hypothetical protein